MNQNKKYFGMTMTQLGILGGLGVMVILLFCFVGILFVRKGAGGAAQQSVPATLTLQPTATLILTPTQTSTPGPTPVPYESLIPAGWTQYRTALYEIWMLPGYKSAKGDLLVNGLGGDPIVDLSLRGATSTKAANKIYLSVAYEPMTDDSFDAFINQRLLSLGLPPSERSKVTLNTIPAVRLVFTGRKGNIDFNQLTYVLLDGTTVWYVQYSAQINDFYNLLPNFEASARTFRWVK